MGTCQHASGATLLVNGLGPVDVNTDEEAHNADSTHAEINARQRRWSGSGAATGRHKQVQRADLS